MKIWYDIYIYIYIYVCIFFGFKDIFGGLVMVVTWRVEEKLLWVAVAGRKGRRDHVWSGLLLKRVHVILKLREPSFCSGVGKKVGASVRDVNQGKEKKCFSWRTLLCFLLKKLKKGMLCLFIYYVKDFVFPSQKKKKKYIYIYILFFLPTLSHFKMLHSSHRKWL